MITRRRFTAGAVAAAACALPTPTPAQTYPVKPVRIIVPFAPGGVDVTARLIADRLTAALGQPFIVENRPGAGGAVGAKMVTSSEPDGYTLMFSTPGPVVVSPLINRNAGYDTLKNLAPVAIVSQSPLLLLVHPSVPVKTVKELVAYAKANPGKVHYPSPGFGTQPHLVGEMFKSMTGLDIVHVPYRGSAPAITDLLAGQMQIYFDNFANVLQHVDSGKLRAIAVTGDARSPQLPDVATMRESGFGEIEATYWNGLFAPAGTPLALVERLNAAVNQALAVPEVHAALKKLGSDPKTGTSQEYAAFIAQEVQRWGKVVRDANIKVD
ncbi:MAG TPA: tripartite tricarboxylate transporter substrate binding protein [Xanthobacteraceae bacterium]|nr:tripartite tricarboxylate transporter substrate binding protein [Xanthobacteraceae bacterium]